MATRRFSSDVNTDRSNIAEPVVAGALAGANPVDILFDDTKPRYMICETIRRMATRLEIETKTMPTA